MAFYSLLLALFSCYIAYHLVKTTLTKIGDWQFAKTHGCKPVKKFPQSERLLGIGHVREMYRESKNNNFMRTLAREFQMMGSTWYHRFLDMNVIATMDPENIKAVLAVNFKDYEVGGRITTIGDLLGSGIFTTDGEKWEHSRTQLHESQVANLDTFETHIQQLISKIPRNGTTVDLAPLFYGLTLHTAMEFLCGESVGGFQGSEKQMVQLVKDFDTAQRGIVRKMDLGPFRMFHRDPEYKAAVQRVHKFVDQVVQRALEYRKMQDAREKNGQSTEEERYVFAHELTKATQDPLQLRNEILSILLAGRDTTAGLLSFVFYTLARRPDVFQKLKQEIDQLGGQKPGYEQLKGMQYLRWVLNETLRLYPIIPVNSRLVNKRTIIPRGGGPDGTSPVLIPKGWIVQYVVYSMHRREDIYGPDAEEFKPERWEKLRVGWEYLPFNGGPRICIGQQFALTEASYTIVRLLQEFGGIESRDSRALNYKMTLTMASLYGCKVGMIPRE